MVEVATSLLSIDEEKSIQTIYDIEVAGTDYFHIDVMDGKFVKRDTIELMRKYTEYIKQIANTKIEVHLMVKDVLNFVKAYIDMDVDCIMFHVEACRSESEIADIIKYLKDNNTKVGLVINPKTEINKIFNYLPYIHRVLVMSVEPGEGGQKFIENSIGKIQELNKYIYENGYEVDIEVDGGVNNENAELLSDAGANIIVAGSYIANSNNYKEAIESIRK
ncbi:MAG: ribulose-phosphate 3-epimerase [Clostridia bacterium]|nr:ribulose-phosphate 3-epimerase [Clostridia bacterium]